MGFKTYWGKLCMHTCTEKNKGALLHPTRVPGE